MTTFEGVLTLYKFLRLIEETENARAYANEFAPEKTFSDSDYRIMAQTFIDNHDMTIPDIDQWFDIVTTYPAM